MPNAGSHGGHGAGRGIIAAIRFHDARAHGRSIRPLAGALDELVNRSRGKGDIGIRDKEKFLIHATVLAGEAGTRIHASAVADIPAGIEKVHPGAFAGRGLGHAVGGAIIRKHDLGAASAGARQGVQKTTEVFTGTIGHGDHGQRGLIWCSHNGPELSHRRSSHWAGTLPEHAKSDADH